MLPPRWLTMIYYSDIDDILSERRKIWLYWSLPYCNNNWVRILYVREKVLSRLKLFVYPALQELSALKRSYVRRLDTNYQSILLMLIRTNDPLQQQYMKTSSTQHCRQHCKTQYIRLVHSSCTCTREPAYSESTADMSIYVFRYPFSLVEKFAWYLLFQTIDMLCYTCYDGVLEELIA